MRYFGRRGALRLGAPLGLVLLLTGCGIHSLHMEQSPLLRLFVHNSGHIAYVGADGNLFIAEQSGQATRLTSSGQTLTDGKHVTYVSPTWGPDGKRIAYARYVVDPSNGSSKVQFHVLDWSTKKNTLVFQSTKLKPFYFNWSPNGRHLAILSNSRGGTLQFGIADPAKPNSYHELATGAPYYWAWAPSGAELVTHSDFTPLGGGRLSIIKVGSRPRRIRVSDRLGRFQAPAVLPDGRIVVVVGNGTSSQLATVSPATGKVAPFGPVDHGSFLFSLSPSGKRLAYLEPRATKQGTRDTLDVRDMQTGKRILSVGKLSTIAYYWSPKGDRIALLTPARRQGKLNPEFTQVRSLPLLSLHVVNVHTGATWKVATFPPTRPLLSTLPFSDQYQQSETIWSPDERYLLFTAYTNKEAAGVFVVDASGNIQARKIADGDSASWSWR